MKLKDDKNLFEFCLKHIKFNVFEGFMVEFESIIIFQNEKYKYHYLLLDQKLDIQQIELLDNYFLNYYDNGIYFYEKSTTGNHKYYTQNNCSGNVSMYAIINKATLKSMMLNEFKYPDEHPKFPSAIFMKEEILKYKILDN